MAEVMDKKLCPESVFRDRLSEDDFWEHVLQGHVPAVDGPDFGEDVPTSNQTEPCSECGESGACGYDMEGRPMVHVSEAGDIDD